MISARYKIPSFTAMAKYLPKQVQCRIVSAEVGYRGRGTGPLIAKETLRELIDFRPDIVYTDYPSYPSWYSKLYSTLRMKHVPLVALLRGDFWSEYQALFHSVGFPAKLIGPLYLFAWSTGLGMTDRILAVCDWLKEIVAARYPDKKVGVLHEGIDPEPWLVREKSLFDFRKPTVGLVQDNNILPKVKGLLWFSNVVKNMPDVNFYIAGGGPYTPLVEKAFADVPNAHLVGKLSYPDEVRRFYQSINVYALPSGLDCCPATLLEASVSELPVVASRVGGIPELIEQGVTGWALPNDQTGLWIQRLRSLLEDSALSRKLGKMGRNFAVDNFSWETQAPRLMSILREECTPA